MLCNVVIIIVIPNDEVIMLCIAFPNIRKATLFMSFLRLEVLFQPPVFVMIVVCFETPWFLAPQCL